jgi:hypothetical protein
MKWLLLCGAAGGLRNGADPERSGGNTLRRNRNKWNEIIIELPAIKREVSLIQSNGSSLKGIASRSSNEEFIL